MTPHLGPMSSRPGVPAPEPPWSGPHALSRAESDLRPMGVIQAEALAANGAKPEPPHRPFTSLPGLPARDDPELTALMGAVRALAREGLQETVRSLLRCALAAERTGDPAFMAALAADGLVTFRCRAARLAETTEG